MMRGLDEMDSTSVECPLESCVLRDEDIKPNECIIGIPKVSIYLLNFYLRNIIMNFFLRIVTMHGRKLSKFSKHLVFKHRVYLFLIQLIRLFVIIF